jgi:uncharacterized metal-binding protein (TIGR02443 family)
MSKDSKEVDLIQTCPKCKSHDVRLVIEDGVSIIDCHDCGHKQEDVGLDELRDWFEQTL